MQQSGFGNWSVSFGGGDLSFGQPPVLAAADALLAAHGHAVPVHPQQWLWFATDASAGVPVSPDEAFVLGQCPTFARRDEHLNRLAQQIRASVQQLSPIMDRLIERQLLKPLKRYVPGPSQASESAPAPSLVIRTCRRPATLKALLESLSAETLEHLTGPMYVVDDSGDPASEGSTRALTATYASDRRQSIRVLGVAEREAWRARALAMLQLSEAERAVLDELLSPERAPAPVPGRAFNWAILLGAGQTLSVLDDDFQLPLKRFASAGQELELQNSLAYRAAFPDPGDDDTLTPVQGDPYAEARGLIGQNLGHLVATRAFEADANAGQNLSEFSWLQADRRVRAVIQGTYGSFGVASSLNLCGPGQRTLASLLRPPFRLERLQADPIHYGLDRIRLAPAAVSLPWLIDARQLVPPTNACGVAEDTLFASLLTLIHPDTCFAYVPTMIGHYQTDHRDRLQASQQPIGFGPNHWIAQRLQQDAGSHGADAADRLQALATTLKGWAAEPDSVLDRLACRWWNEERANAAALLAQTLQQVPDAPRPFVEFVESMRVANLRQERELGAANLKHLRRALDQTALACRVWPALFDLFAGHDPLNRHLA
ncbi:hypothetical protein C7S18_05260 [Ahniella affigens]|uniref:Uncharacterized protein n=1 Tax=Ahniella affigens TaxID=2021234 RepID=A0A2P1PP84_9GAMM|nr:hypothetical protein [Ahniella affigens]AVP96647.1 hypothetical protein C7S18_05260 [Ahniella affigens]